MAIELSEKETYPLKANEYEVVYKGDWNDGDYLYSFNTVTKDNLGQLVMWLDFFLQKENT